MTTFRAVLLSTAAIAFAAPAFAADLTYEAPPAADSYTPPAGFTWTGPYLGVVIGYGTGDFDADAAPGDLDVDGFQAGVYGGYNFDLGNQVVLGVEGDILWSGVEGDASDGEADESFNSTLRGRVGYTMDRYMVYGTGGLAVANAEVDDTIESDSNTHVGWVVGAGVEAALTDNVIAKVEYQYQNYGAESYDLSGGETDVDYATHSIRAGVGLKF